MMQVLAQTAPAATVASAPRYGDLPLRRDADGDAAGSMAWAGVVLLVVLAAAFLWRKKIAPPARGGQTINVASGRPLTSSASLHVVEWEGERLLVGCTPQSVEVLARRTIEANDDKTGAPS